MFFFYTVLFAVYLKCAAYCIILCVFYLISSAFFIVHWWWSGFLCMCGRFIIMCNYVFRSFILILCQIVLTLCSVHFLIWAVFNCRNKALTAKILKQGYRYHKLCKAFSKFYRLHSGLVEKYDVSLRKLLRQGISEPEFYGDLVSE